MKIWRWACCTAKASSIMPSDIDAVESSTRRPNVVNVRLRPDVHMEIQTATRRFSAGSSCGVCGTTGLDAAIARAAATRIADDRRDRLDACCSVCPSACARLSQSSATPAAYTRPHYLIFPANLITVAEDVGRHNAIDKLVGEIIDGRAPAAQRTHHSAERTGEFRAHSKGAAHRRRHTRSHRRSLESRGESRRSPPV